MKKIFISILIVTLCLSACVFASCGTAVFTAEEMMDYCNDSIALDPLTGVNEIAISADLYAVAVHNVDGDKVTIDFTHHDKTSVKAEAKDSTLYIIQESEPLTMYIGGTLCLVIGIPESWTGYTLGANIDVGSLSIENSNAALLEIDLNTGSANINVASANALHVDVDTGAVKLTGKSTLVDVDADTGSVNVDMQAEILQLSTDTGAIKFDVVGGKQIDLESDTGSIVGTIDQAKELYTITVDVETGSCNLSNQTGTSANTLNIDVETGSAKITFTN